MNLDIPLGIFLQDKYLIHIIYMEQLFEKIKARKM